VAAVAALLSGAYVTGAIVQSQSVQKEQASVKDFYAAEKGIEYAFLEAQNHGWDWKTHTIGDASVLNSNGTPGVTLGGAAYNPASGCYEVPSPSGLVQIKSYADPTRNYETWVLSRSGSKIIRFKLTRRSMYKYLYYYPAAKAFTWMNIDGRGVGGIYVNGNISLLSTTFTNITELSTNPSSGISKYNFNYIAPYKLDEMLGGAGSRDGRAPLPASVSPYIYSPTNPYPWQNGNWPPYAFPPYDWWNVNRHFYADPASGYNFPAATVNGVNLPISLDTSWNWTKYSSSSLSEVPVRFYSSDGALATDAYWANLATKVPGGANYFDQDFWTTKTYQRTSSTVPVKFLNTVNQWDDWTNWLNSTGSALRGIVKTGVDGYSNTPVSIEANYSRLAKTGGLYIGKDISGNLDIWLNGNKIDSLPSWITDNVQFFNTVRPKIVSGSPTRENVLQLDIANSLTSSQIPANGIIYIAHKNLRLVNGAKLPMSLTVVSPYNIYIKGNYNTDAAWQPAAVISNSLVYTLSNDFVDYADLPATIYPREYPYELQYVNLANFVLGDTDRLRNLEIECQNFFGLGSSFDLHSAGSQPADLNALQTKIRNKYNADYTANMPNRVSSDVAMKVAIASPYEPQGYQLERWTKEAWGPVSVPGYTRSLTITGAFIKLAGFWSPSRDVPDDQSSRKRTGRANLAGLNPSPMVHNGTVYTSVTPYLKYDERFATPSGTPSSDFFSGSQAIWQEIANSDFNFTHHLPGT